MHIFKHRSKGADMAGKTIEQRFDDLEKDVDAAFQALKSFGGQLQSIGKDKGLTLEERVRKMSEICNVAGGQLASLQKRGRDR